MSFKCLLTPGGFDFTSRTGEKKELKKKMVENLLHRRIIMAVELKKDVFHKNCKCCWCLWLQVLHWWVVVFSILKCQFIYLQEVPEFQKIVFIGTLCRAAVQENKVICIVKLSFSFFSWILTVIFVVCEKSPDRNGLKQMSLSLPPPLPFYVWMMKETVCAHTPVSPTPE